VTSLVRIDTGGWRAGLENLLRKENRAFWGTRQWWGHVLLWLALWNGLLAVTLWLMPTMAAPFAEGERPLISLEQNVAGFFSLAAMFVAVGVVVAAHGAILDEHRTGTLELLLSKPVSRTAVVLSKLVALSGGLLMTIVVVQGAVAYLQISLAAGAWWDVGAFAAALAVTGLYLLFFLVLTLTLSVFTSQRGVVFGLPLLLVLGAQFIVGALPALAYVTPYGLLIGQAAPDSGPLALALVFGSPVTSWSPAIGTVAGCVGLAVAAVWRLGREDL
jgi:ABC-2 type transport system permease protein